MLLPTACILWPRSVLLRMVHMTISSTAMMNTGFGTPNNARPSEISVNARGMPIAIGKAA